MGEIMIGEEFLNKIREMKKITNIYWDVKGDYFEPDEVKIVVVAADGEKIEVNYPRPKSENEFFQNVCIALIISKFMEQLGNDDFNITIYDDLAKATNCTISLIHQQKCGDKDA